MYRPLIQNTNTEPKNKTWVFAISILLSVLILIIIFIIVIWLTARQKTLKEPDDVLLHISSETETPMRFVRNALMYEKNVSVLSANQISLREVYDANGIDKFDIKSLDYLTGDFLNYRNHYFQGYTEYAETNNYAAVKLTTARPLEPVVKIKGPNGNYCYVCLYERLVDKKRFYFIQMTQSYKNYLEPKSYRGISELLMYIKAKYPGDYIFVGDFNVQGHERIFEHHLGRSNYHICDFYKTITCNDHQGLASPDGLVVSKNLYEEVRYFVDVYPGFSVQHFIVGAHMYIKSPIPRGLREKTVNVTSKSMLRLIDLIKANNKRDNFVNNSGAFDATNAEMLGDAKNISATAMTSFTGAVYMNKTLTAKLASLVSGASADTSANTIANTSGNTSANPL